MSKTQTRSFQDAKGITRNVDINPLSVALVRERIGIDLPEIVDPEFASTLSENIPALANCIGIVAFPADMPERDVAEALADDNVFPAAVDALILAIADYMPRKARKLLKKAWRQTASA